MQFRYILLFLPALLFHPFNSSAQEIGRRGLEKSFPAHQVSGIVIDSLGVPLVAATVLLKSVNDSVRLQTNKDGIFVFENIKKAAFTIQVSYTGYQTRVAKYLFNEDTRVIVLEPIIMLSQPYELKDVVVNGTPAITYKKDTVEYRASDYKVQQYATVSELLKQMEGMEVGADGKLFFHGELVKIAKLNGKEFLGGDVKDALENLPAGIVEKIQIIDDFGDFAAKTGIKNEASTKTLNVTTQADKSIANIALLKAQAGTSARFEEQASFENIKGNSVLAVNENVQKTITGINATDATNNTSPAPDYVDASPPGTTIVETPGISYTNDSGNGLSFTGSYNFLYNTNQLSKEALTQLYSALGSTFSTGTSNNNTYLKTHQARAKLNYEITKFDFVQILADFAYTNQGGAIKSQSENINDFVSGQQNFNSTIQDFSNNNKSNFKLNGFYLRTFKKPRRFISLQLSLNPTIQHIIDDKATNYRYYNDSLTNIPLVDSVSHLKSAKAVTAKTSEVTLIYAEPVKTSGLLEIYFNIRNTSYSNSASTDTIYQDGRVQELYRLRNDFNYNFLEYKFSTDYHYTTANTELVLGAAPYWANIKEQSSINSPAFALLPVFSYTHAWSKMERLDLEYHESTLEPTAQQFQPYTDNTDPNNIIVGNPAIKSTLIHTLSASYNRYFPNDLLNVSVNAFYRIFQHDITTSLTQVIVPVGGGLDRTTNEISYLNVDGDKNAETKYSLSKQWIEQLIKLELDGDVSYFYRQALSNFVKYSSTQWHFSNRLGPRITFEEKAGLNPYVGYIIDRSVTNTANAVPSTTKSLIAAVSGYYNLPYGYQLHSSATKNYLSGFGNYNTNPFVVNAGLERRLLKRQNLMLTVDIFDLFNQNNFVQQTITPEATVYTKSNTSNRYLLVGLQYNFQKWGGTPSRNGLKMKRKGDGSFY